MASTKRIFYPTEHIGLKIGKRVGQGDLEADIDAAVYDLFDLTDDEHYYDCGCTIVSTGQKIPIAAEFTESKQAPEGEIFIEY